MSGTFGQESLLEFAEHVQSLPPEQRFTDSVSAFRKLFEADAGAENQNEPEEILEAVAKADGQAIYQMFQLLDMAASRIRQRALENAMRNRDHAQGSALFALFLEELRDASSQLETRSLQEVEDGQSRAYLSRFIALYSRFLLIVLDELEEIDPLLEDILYSQYFRAKLANEEPSFDPAERDSDEARAECLKKAASLLYRERNITVSRGAELAEVSEAEFREYLEQQGIEIRYGPDSAADLDGGPNLLNE
jgi:predicted HTH domain antitoxin